MRKHTPKVLLLGFASYCALVDFEKIRSICDKYGAFFVFDCPHTIGLMLSGIIPNSFHHAHITVASTCKTIPGLRGGLIITKSRERLDCFVSSLSGVQTERGFNLITAAYLGISECLTPAYELKMKKALQIAKHIENFFDQPEIIKKGYKKINSTEIHMITIDCGFDVNEICGIFRDCNLCISNFFVPNTNRYGLRFICTTTAILDYSLEEINEILEVIWEILDNRERIMQRIPILSEKMKKIALRHPLFINKEVKNN